MSNNKQSSVEYYINNLIDILGDEICNILTIEQTNRIHFLEKQAKAMQQEQAQQYAEFCIRCDRESLPILDFNSWIAHNETFGGNNEQK